MDYLLQALSTSVSDSVGLHPTLRIFVLALASVGLGYINWRGMFSTARVHAFEMEDF